MAMTKSRRGQPQPSAPAIIMATPPPRSPAKSKASGYSEVEKQGLLQNFDVEVADKTQFFRSILARTLASFTMREESEILAIPRDLRKMTLGELEQKWGGGWAGTLQRIRRESLELREKVREREEEEKVGEVKKRKRNTAADSSPVRPNKNTRRDATSATPSTARKTRQPIASSSVTKGKPTSSTGLKRKPVSSSSTSKPSSLPQNHIFNPSLPPTPFRSTHSQSARSTRGAGTSSPLDLSRPSSSRAHHTSDHHNVDGDEDDSTSVSSSGPGSGSEGEDEDEDEDELPDAEALEAKLLAEQTLGGKSQSSRNTKSKSKKRGPSLIFRQSLAPNQLVPSTNEENEGDGGPISTVSLSDGRTISFNPLNLTPGRVDKELDQGGVSKEEKARISKVVHEEVFKSLHAQMEKWKM